MRQEDFYTGEPVNSGSLPNFQNENIINTSPSAEVEAANMASFGKYDYDAFSRNMNAPMQFNGGYGGQFNPYGYGGGIGSPPQFGYGYNYGYNPQMQYGYYNQQPTYNYYRNNSYGYNTPFMQQQYQQPEQPTTYHIPGVNLGGEYLPPLDYEQRIHDMQMEYFYRQQDMEAEQDVKRQGSVYGYGNMWGNNYYGVPYYNPYQYNSLNSEFQSRIKAMQDEARENRLQFNLNIAKLAHNIANQPISEEDLMERYAGKTVDIPQAYIQPREEYYEQMRFINMVPFDNSQLYRDHWAKVQKEYTDIIPKDADLKETFAKMAIISANWEMEEEMHRRRNAGTLYNSQDNSYKYFVRRKAAERYAKERGIEPSSGLPSFNMMSLQQQYVANNPLLSKVANLSDDGTLNVSFNLPCNVGSHKGETYSVHNSQEAEYAEKKDRFSRFLNGIDPGDSYLEQLKKDKIERYSNG